MAWNLRPEYRGAGSFLYSEGHRICVSASHGKGMTKVGREHRALRGPNLSISGLQKAFGDFGHIYQWLELKLKWIMLKPLKALR